MSGSEERGWKGREEALPIALLVLIAALFFLSFFNRFAGLRSGDGEFQGGIALLQHRLPYRDYYTAGPPLNQIKSALELAVFGRALIVSRAMGVVERLLIAVLLYAGLRRLFSRPAAWLAAVVTIIVSAGDRTDPIASYNHDAILFAMLCGTLAVCGLRPGRPRTLLWWTAAIAAGAAAAASSLTKQTVGLGTFAVVLLVGVTVRWRLRGLRNAILWSAAFLIGFALPIAVMALYLAHLHVLRDGVTMMFISGPAAKASQHGTFLWREWTVLLGNPPWVILAAVASLLSARPVWRSLHAASIEAGNSQRWLHLVVAAIGLSVLVAIALGFTSLPALEDFSKSAVYYALFGTIVLAGLLMGDLLVRTRPSPRTAELALHAAVGATVALTLSLSWPAFEAMTLPGLGLLLAAIYDGARLNGRRFLVLVAMAMVFIQVREKLALPFAFDGQNEPATRLATVALPEPMLRGMRLPASTADLLQAIDREAAPLRKAGNTVSFSYPEMGLLYPLTGTVHPTRSGSHNIDVVPDAMAREEAQRLLRTPPPLILYARPTEEELASAERTWRRSARSGQRDLVAALDRIVAGYRLAGTFRLDPGDDPIRLYVAR